MQCNTLLFEAVKHPLDSTMWTILSRYRDNPKCGTIKIVFVYFAVFAVYCVAKKHVTPSI